MLAAEVMSRDHSMRQTSECDLLPVSEIDIGDFLAPGTYYSAYSGRYRGKNVEVLNFTDSEVLDQAKLQEASTLLESIQCPTVISMIGLAWWRGSYWVVLDRVRGESLCDLIERHAFPPETTWLERTRIRNGQLRALSPARVASWSVDMLSALIYLESRGIRPLLTSEQLIISERGFEPPAMMLKHPGEAVYLDMNRVVATHDERVRWLAPEILRCDPKATASTRSGQWSLGIVFWEIAACKSPPYAETTTEQLVREVAFGGRKPEVPNHFPRILATVIRSCLDENPLARPDFGAVEATLRASKISDYRINPVAPSTGRPSSDGAPRATGIWRQRSNSFAGMFSGTLTRTARRKSVPTRRIVETNQEPSVWESFVSRVMSLKPKFQVAPLTPPRSTQKARGFTTRAAKVFNPTMGKMGLDIIPYGTGDDTGAVIIAVAKDSPCAASRVIKAGQVIVGINTDLLLGKSIAQIERLVAQFPQGEIVLHVAPMTSVEPVMAEWVKREVREAVSPEKAVLAHKHDPELAEFLELERELNGNTSPLKPTQTPPSKKSHENSFEHMHEAVQLIRKRILLLDDSISGGLDGLAPTVTAGVPSPAKDATGQPDLLLGTLGKTHQTTAVARAVHSANVDWSSGTGKLSGSMKDLIKRTVQKEMQRRDGGSVDEFDDDIQFEDEDDEDLVPARRTPQSAAALSQTIGSPSRPARMQRPPASPRRRTSSETTATRTAALAAKSNAGPASPQRPRPRSSSASKPVALRRPAPSPQAPPQATPPPPRDPATGSSVLGFVTTSHFNPSGSHIVNEKRLHKQAKEKDPNLHICGKCGFTSKTPGVLDNHMRAKHPERTINRELATGGEAPKVQQGLVPRSQPRQQAAAPPRRGRNT